MVTISMVTETN